MTEYVETPAALEEWRASRARTHDWVHTSPPPINPRTGSQYYLPASRAPSGADSDNEGLKPHSEWDGDGWEPSDCESSHSVPPVMELQYPGGETIKIGSASTASRHLRDELDRNLPGAPMPVPPPQPAVASASGAATAAAASRRRSESRSGSVKSHRTSRTTTTAAARAAPLPPSLPSSGSGSGSGGQRSPTRSHHSQPSQHSRARTRSLPHTEHHFIDVDGDGGHPLPPIPSQAPSQGFPFNPVPQPMSISPAYSRSTQPEQIMIRPPASQRSQSNASNNSNSYPHTQSSHSHHSPTSPNSPHSAGGFGGGHFPSSYSRGTVAAGVPLPAPSTMSASLSYVTADNAAASHHGHGQLATPYPQQNELPSAQTSMYGHGMASVTPSQSPSNQATPQARSRAMDVGEGQGTPRALSRAHTLLSNRTQSHRSPPQSPHADDDQGGGGGGGFRPESYVFVEPPFLPAPMGSSRRSASGSQGQGQGHAHSHSYPPPSVHGGSQSQSSHMHSVHNPPTLAQRYADRGIAPPSQASRSQRSRSGESRRESRTSGAAVGGAGFAVGSQRSESRMSGSHPPSIVYAPARHSRGTHFSPPRIVHMPSAHGSSGNAVIPQGPVQGQLSPTHGSVQQQQMDASAAQPLPQQQLQQGTARQMTGTPASSLRRAHTVSHHSGPASISVSVRPPSQQSLRSGSRSRGPTVPQAVTPGAMGSPGMVASASAPLPAMSQDGGGGTMVIPRGLPTPPASANGHGGGGGGSVYGGGSVHGNGSAGGANGMDSWGRASQASKKSKGSKRGPASNASVGSLLLGGRRSGSVSRDIGAVAADSTPARPPSRGGFMSRFRDLRLTGGGHPNANGREQERGRGLERGNSGSGGSRSSSHSSASTYYVLPNAGQKVKILRPDGTAVSTATTIQPNHTRSASSVGSGWLKKALTPGRFFRSSSHHPSPSEKTSHRSRASMDVPMSRDMANEKEPDGGVAFTSGGVTVAPTAPSVAHSSRTRTTSERSGGRRKLVRRGSEAATTASAATSAGNAGIGAGGRVSVAAS